MATNGFSMCKNFVLFDLDLSLEAIGLYAKLKHMSTIPNFKIKRDYIKFISGYGETAFRRVWKELKEKKVLIENKTRNMGRYKYEFYLADENKINAEEETKEVKQKINVDSDGNVPMEGQVSINTILDNDQENNDVLLLKESTRLSENECRELLKCTGNDVNKVIQYYNYTLKKQNIGNVFKYLRACIVNNFKIPRTSRTKPKGNFNNFEQRHYNFESLERKLLGWESGSLEECYI